jgi:Tfp pilus assembly PilM family ATPase
VLVAATPEEPVLERLECLRRAGLEVEAMEIAPMAVRRLVAGFASDPIDLQSGDIALVLRMRGASTELTLLSGQRLLLYREIGIGTDAIVQAVAKGLDSELEAARDLLALYGVGLGAGLPGPSDSFGSSDEIRLPGDAEEVCGTLREIVRPSLRALVEQAHKAISYAAFQTRGTSIDKVYLLEGGASCPGFESLLAEMLHLPVEFLRPLGRFETRAAPVSVVNEARIAVALGFSMRGLVDV